MATGGVGAAIPDSIQEILERSQKYLKAANLRPFILTLPLHGPAAESNQEGIREKIMKNKSYVVTEQNPESNVAQHYPQSLQFVNQIVDRLTSNDIVGFVMVVAEYLGVDQQQQHHTLQHSSASQQKTRSSSLSSSSSVATAGFVSSSTLSSTSTSTSSLISTSTSTSFQDHQQRHHHLSGTEEGNNNCRSSSDSVASENSNTKGRGADNRGTPEAGVGGTSPVGTCQYRPVAGGIVELLDEYERAIRGVWCRRSLPEAVVETFLKVVVMRVVAHAFEWQHPSKPNKKTNSKLVSSLEIHALSFPTETHRFLTTPDGLSLSKHWETDDDGGAHNDSPNQRCKCFKLADKEGAWQFWGISESRFIKSWSARKDFFIPNEPSNDLVQLFMPVGCAGVTDNNKVPLKETKSSKRLLKENNQIDQCPIPIKRKY